LTRPRDQEIERIDVRLAEDALPGASPEGVALSEDEKTLYVAKCHSNAVAVVALSGKTRGGNAAEQMTEAAKSKILDSFRRVSIPSAVVVADGKPLHRKWERNGIRTFLDAREQQRAHSESTQHRVSSE